MAFLRIEFHPNGDDGPVKAFLDHLAYERPRGYAKVALDIEVLGTEGFLSRQVSVRNLGDGLWELRRRFEGIQYRVFGCFMRSRRRAERRHRMCCGSLR